VCVVIYCGVIKAESGGRGERPGSLGGKLLGGARPDFLEGVR
jgi:hypothetical protein